ncbi:MAG: hypothetical protein CFE45_14955 [Burkholderiales bacterium PBB5]|nr:MAG: hypothetical protein CFE45_14955 [Burkholderiales bacterium PBB5]
MVQGGARVHRAGNRRETRRWHHRGSEPCRRGTVTPVPVAAGHPNPPSAVTPHPLPDSRPAALPPARRPLVRRGLCLLLSTVLAWSPPLAALAQNAGTADPAPAPAPLRLPSLGESAAEDFNLSTEKRLGEQIMRDIRRDPDYLDDPQLLDYLQSIWAPLVAAARERGDIDADTAQLFPYESFLVRDRSVNAFALPGGYVGVHLGLMAITASRDELASVLAHELSHITQRHIARSIAASSRASTVGLAAMILAVLASARASSYDGVNAAIMGSQAAMVQAQLNFSRDMEREADRNGITLMSTAGFAPSGMAAMFEKLDQSSRLNDSGAYPYLRSHPLTVDRIGEARQRSHSLASSGPARGGAPLLHTLMQARSRVLMDPSATALRRQQALQARGEQEALPLAERLAALYGAALASAQLKEWPQAERGLAAAQALLAQAPAPQDTSVRQPMQRLAVQLALGRGDAPRARQLLADGPTDASRAGVLLRAQVALADGSAPALRQVSDDLQTWVADHRQDASAWQLLSAAATRQGQTLRAIRAEAEAEAALGNLRGAIARLRAGQQQARRGGADFIEASVIDARLRDLNAQRRDLQADQRKNGGGGPAPLALD